MIRVPKLFLGSSAAAIIFTMAVLPVPAWADSTPECNTNDNPGPDGVAGTPDDIEGSTECGAFSFANGSNSTAVGASAVIFGNDSTAIGESASVSAENSVALGRKSEADEDNVVSVGSVIMRRRITNVADGTNFSDAVNVAQMNEGDFIAQRDAQAYTDTRETLIRTDMAAGDAATLDAANGYTDTREAAIRADVASAGAATLADANAYTDTREAAIRTDMTTADDRIEGLANGAQRTADTAIVRVDALGASAANALGGGSAYNAATGAVSAPSYMIGGQSFNNVGSAFDAVDTRLAGLDFDIRRLDRLVGRGVAIATAMASIPPLDGDKKIGIGVGTGTYDGRFAFSAAIIGRVSDSAQFRLNAGTAGNGKVAAGGGMTLGF